MSQPVERRLAAILAADVAGYSRLMGADEEGTHERLTAHFRALAEPGGSASPGRCATTSETSSLTRSRIGASRASRTSLDPCGSTPCNPESSPVCPAASCRPPCQSLILPLHHACRSSCCPLPI